MKWLVSWKSELVREKIQHLGHVGYVSVGQGSEPEAEGNYCVRINLSTLRFPGCYRILALRVERLGR